MTEDPTITENMIKIVDAQVEDASRDFDKIEQDGCEHDREKVLNIDVDKILGFPSEFEFNQNNINEIENDAEATEEFEVPEYASI